MRFFTGNILCKSRQVLWVCKKNCECKFIVQTFKQTLLTHLQTMECLPINSLIYILIFIFKWLLVPFDRKITEALRIVIFLVSMLCVMISLWRFDSLSPARKGFCCCVLRVHPCLSLPEKKRCLVRSPCTIAKGLRIFYLICILTIFLLSAPIGMQISVTKFFLYLRLLIMQEKKKRFSGMHSVEEPRSVWERGSHLHWNIFFDFLFFAFVLQASLHENLSKNIVVSKTPWRM